MHLYRDKLLSIRLALISHILDFLCLFHQLMNLVIKL